MDPRGAGRPSAAGGRRDARHRGGLVSGFRGSAEPHRAPGPAPPAQRGSATAREALSIVSSPAPGMPGGRRRPAPAGRGAVAWPGIGSRSSRSATITARSGGVDGVLPREPRRRSARCASISCSPATCTGRPAASVSSAASPSAASHGACPPRPVSADGAMRSSARLRRVGRGLRCRLPDAGRVPAARARRIAAMHAAKRAVLAAPDGPLLLANSAWTAARAQALAPSGTAIEPLALAFPTGVFRPGDRTELRRRLGVAGRRPLDPVSRPSSSTGRTRTSAISRKRCAVSPAPASASSRSGGSTIPGGSPCRTCSRPASIADEDGARRLVRRLRPPRHREPAGDPRPDPDRGRPVRHADPGLPDVGPDQRGDRRCLGPARAGEDGALGDALADLVADRAALARLGAFARIALESRFSPAASAMSLDRDLPGPRLAAGRWPAPALRP